MLAEPPCVILLYRAIRTLEVVADPDLHWFVVGSVWPVFARRYLDAYNPDHETEVAWCPTPHDVDVYLSVLAWERGLTRQQRNIMRLRAKDYSLHLIADILRTPVDQIQADHADAVRIVVAASGRLPIDEPLALVHEPRRHHCV